MQKTLTDRLAKVAVFRHENEEQVIAEALQIGLKKMWLDCVLSQYLEKQISRPKAIALVGLQAVRLAEEQDEAVQEDIKWGRKRGNHHH